MSYKRKKRIEFGVDYWLFVALKETAKDKKISVGKLLRMISKEYYTNPKNQV
jgi:hypothetical protein